MHLTNGSYGHREILCRYARSLTRRPLPFVWQHGWIKHSVLDAHAAPLAPGMPVYTWGPSSAARSEADGLATHGSIGAPIFYLLAQRPALEAVVRRRLAGKVSASGVVLIPDHSTRLDGDAVAHTAFLDNVDVGSSTDVAVLLHPNDYRNATVRGLYEGSGARVLSNPMPLHSPEFIAWQVRLFAAAERVVAQSLGTALWYAAYCGCDVTLQSAKQVVASDWFVREQALGSGIDTDVLEAQDNASWRAVALRELGVGSVQTPDAITALMARPMPPAAHVTGWQNVARSAVLATDVGMHARRRLMG